MIRCESLTQGANASRVSYEKKAKMCNCNRNAISTSIVIIYGLICSYIVRELKVFLMITYSKEFKSGGGEAK
jgi:hypothetical protein